MTSAAAIRRHHPQGGFALVMVLWVLAGLTVVAVAVASSLRVSSESVKLLRERVGNESRFLSTAARIQVIASTGNGQRNAIESSRGRLLVDGRPLLVTAGEWVSVQDVRGLLDLNDPGRRLTGLLLRCGAREDNISALSDALADYVDRDDLKRLNGAEAFDYRLVNMEAPRNASLMSREELWRVKGWREFRPAWQAAGCDAWVTAHGDGRFNPNTAPPALLQADGLTAENAAALMDARQDGLPLLRGSATAPDANSPMAFLGGGFVGDTLRIRHLAASVEWSLEYELQLTPASEGGPWRLHELRYPPRLALPSGGTVTLPPVDFLVTEREGQTTNVLPNLPSVK